MGQVPGQQGTGPVLVQRQKHYYEESYYEESGAENVRVRQGLWAVHQVRFDFENKHFYDVQIAGRDLGQAHRVPTQAQQQQLQQLLQVPRLSRLVRHPKVRHSEVQQRCALLVQRLRQPQGLSSVRLARRQMEK